MCVKFLIGDGVVVVGEELFVWSPTSASLCLLRRWLLDLVVDVVVRAGAGARRRVSARPATLAMKLDFGFG